ncbi:hypothetical protein QBC39DRAFT_354430 [Podospora conica]|nr:hypothetical protein QBC39DRAFT_354430 [Schizothecium conicum]
MQTLRLTHLTHLEGAAIFNKPTLVRKELGGGGMVELRWSFPTTPLSWKEGYSHETLGYDADGFPCRLPGNSSGLDSHQYIQRVVRVTPAKARPPWAGQQLGKEWTIICDGRIPDHMLPVLLSEFILDDDQEKLHHNAPRAFHIMFRKFIGNHGNMFRARTVMFKLAETRDIYLHFNVRLLTPPTAVRRTKPSSDRTHFRSFGCISAPRGSQEIYIEEKRYSVLLRTTCQFDLAIYSLATLEDWYTEFEHKWKPSLAERAEWEASGIQPSMRAAGISAFAFRIRSLFNIWELQWWQLLDGVDMVMEVDLGDILAPERRREMMFDNSELRLSEFYFTLLQTLRIASEWINEATYDLKQMVEYIERSFFSPNSTSIASFLSGTAEMQQAQITINRQNWESVLVHQRRAAARLLDRIAKKQEEVKSLRDGLFSATSINEAARSTQLSNYILVFTIVTIFYLPLSFVAALFALDAFKWENASTKVGFIATTIMVAGATYAMAGFLMWAVKTPEWKDRLKDFLLRLCRQEEDDW